jgi:serine protease SohB
LQLAEVEFVQQLVHAVGPNSAASVRTALLGDIAARGSGGLLTQLQDRPLSALFGGSSGSGTTRKPTVFVTRFPGDATASQVSNLREEVTAIVRQAKPGDEAVVILQTGGGTVTGYGLAAAQLLRFKEAGLKLTVAVEQVAASGGYMMCCVADRIVASPFAVLGSIGVISDIPNVYERLKKEGIEFQTVTAGKYKRTITPTKKVTKEDLVKTTADVENIFILFRDFVGQNRPQLDMEKIATGETWFGSDAMDLGLCDEIATVDTVLIDFVDADYDVYEVAYAPPVPLESKLSALLPFGSIGSEAGEQRGILGKGISWLVRTAATEIKSEFGGADLNLNQSVEKRFMAMDDSSNRIRSQD